MQLLANTCFIIVVIAANVVILFTSANYFHIHYVTVYAMAHGKVMKCDDEISKISQLKRRTKKTTSTAAAAAAYAEHKFQLKYFVLDHEIIPFRNFSFFGFAAFVTLHDLHVYYLLYAVLIAPKFSIR